MTDIVHYKIPYWFTGDIVNTIIVQKQLKEIFEYRFKMSEKNMANGKTKNCNLQFK